MAGWLAKLRQRLQRAAQTRTDADTDRTVHQSRLCGTIAAYRAAVSLLLTVQLVLWTVLTGYDRAAQSLWQAALLLIPAGVLVWAVSRWAWSGEASITARGQAFGGDAGAWDASRPGWQGQTSRPWELLLLLPCLLLDAVVLLNTLLSLLYRLMPSYPATVLRVVVSGLLLLALWLGRDNGVAFGAQLWRWTLLGLTLWAMANVLGAQQTDRLYPLLGKGLLTTAQTAAWGLGGLWPICLLFLMPERTAGAVSPKTGKPPRTLLHVLLPLALCCLAAVTLACAAPWRAGEALSVGHRLQAMGRSGGGVMISGLWALVCLLGLMLSFCIVLTGLQKLLKQTFDRLTGPWPALVAAFGAAALLWVWPDGLPQAVLELLPWRLLLWAAAAGWAAVRRMVARKRGPSIR